MRISEKSYRNLFLFNLTGFLVYSGVSVVTREPAFILCAVIFLISTVMSAKAYSTFKFAKRAMRR